MPSWPDLWTEPAYSDHYSRHRPPYQDVVASWLRDFYRARHPGGEGEVPLAVDVGCGPGQMSAALAPFCSRVLALDISEHQLRAARRDRARPNVEYRRASALELSRHCAAASVDLLVAGHAVHCFNSPAFYAEARRVLRPGGVLVLAGYLVRGLRHDGAGGEGLDSVLADFMKRECIDDDLRANGLLAERYTRLRVPFGEVTRREEVLVTDTSRDGVRRIFLSHPQIFADGEAGIDRFVETLPAQGSLQLVTDVFALLVAC